MTSTTCLIIALQNIIRDAGKLFAAAQAQVRASDAIKAFNTPGNAPANLNPADIIDRRGQAARLYNELDRAEAELSRIVKRIEQSKVTLSPQGEGRGEGETA